MSNFEMYPTPKQGETVSVSYNKPIAPDALAAEICRRIMVRHAVPDPDGRVMLAMRDALSAGEEAK